ncbi:MAG: hypothetical protein HKM95_09285 [Inquilinus sp.]|nr:hypothetical protein [Inquilinus sp.]
MNDDIEPGRDGIDADEETEGAASLAELQARRLRAGLSAGSQAKAGDITDLLAKIDLDEDGDKTAGSPAAGDQDQSAAALRAVRDLDAEPPPARAPGPSAAPAASPQSSPDLSPESASVPTAHAGAGDLADNEIQQELMAMMDRITGGDGDDAEEAVTYADPESPAASPSEPAAPPPPAVPKSEPADAAPEPPPAPCGARAILRTEPRRAPDSAARAEPKPESFSRMPQGLVKYWMSLTGGRRYPSWSDFDQKMIADCWPNSMVLTSSRNDDGEVMIAKVTRIADQDSPAPTGSKRVEYTPALTEWILSLGKEVAGSGKPMQESDRFPTSEGIVRYQIILLPLSDEQSGIDHVLCHVYRA